MPNWCHRFMQLYLAKYSIDAGFRWLNKHCIFFELERRVCAARTKQSIEVRICVDTFNNPVASGCAKHEHKKDETKKKNWNPVAVIHILFPCHGVPYHLGLRWYDPAAYLQLKRDHCQLIRSHGLCTSSVVEAGCFIRYRKNIQSHKLNLIIITIWFSAKKGREKEEGRKKASKGWGERFAPDKQIRRKAFPRAHHPPTPTRGPHPPPLLFACWLSSPSLAFALLHGFGGAQGV